MAAQLNRLIDALLTRLAAIAPVNGYSTELKAVYRGREALRLGDAVEHPFLVVQRLRSRQLKRAGTRTQQRAELLVYGEVRGEADEEEALERLRLDVLRALAPASEEPWLDDVSVTVELGDGIPELPEEGSDVAGLSQYVSLVYVENL